MSYYSYLVSFLSTYRAGTIHKAAEELFLTPAAVSKQIKLLEAKLEQPLFVREGRLLKPNQAAHELAAHVGSSIDRLALVLSEEGPLVRQIRLGGERAFFSMLQKASYLSFLEQNQFIPIYKILTTPQCHQEIEDDRSFAVTI